MNQVISNYAQAFFDLAKENDAVSIYKDELDSVLEVFERINNIKEFFISVRVSKSEKKDILEKTFREKISDNTLNFLKLLIDKNRFDLYKDIIKEFHHMCNDELNIKEGILEVPRILEYEEVKKLQEVLSVDSKVELRQRINKSLISGFKIIMDDKIIDQSMKEKVRQLNSTLMKGDNSWN